MDWVWTDTTLSLSDWMCVEDIYANTFIIKCSRETEKARSIRPYILLEFYVANYSCIFDHHQLPLY